MVFRWDALSGRGRQDVRTKVFHMPAARTCSMKRRRDWPRNVGRPLRRQAIRLRACRQRRCAVGRLMPNRQQISFQRTPAMRARTSAASSGESQPSQRSVSVTVEAAPAADRGVADVASDAISPLFTRTPRTWRGRSLVEPN